MFCLISLAGIAIFSYVISIFIRSAKHNLQVRKMPHQTTHARVVAKRTEVWGDNSYTNYYTTFEFDSRERAELKLSGAQYGMLAEGDDGMLTYQGDRFLEFQRNYI
ncbi:MAG: DUF2500 domain-containing protein [Oscillospiraceae bacterium]|nr:DUF2500 domain-containing protein [Oscillospiraceae bacterium]